MHAAVYRGQSVVSVEEIPTPAIGPGEILIRVEACGICHTDLKKIEYNLLAPPRVYGHETAGVVAAVGASVTQYRPGKAEHVLGVLQERGAGLGEHDAVLCSIEQGHGELLFKLAYLLADRRLCDVQAFRGAAEVQFFRETATKHQVA